MKGCLAIGVLLVILLVLSLGMASCASLLQNARPSNTFHTSCVGLVNIGSCNITQTTNNNTGAGPNVILALVGIIGAGCLLLGAVWPRGGGAE
jgi:hypothetical protein